MGGGGCLAHNMTPMFRSSLGQSQGALTITSSFVRKVRFWVHEAPSNFLKKKTKTANFRAVSQNSVIFVKRFAASRIRTYAGRVKVKLRNHSDIVAHVIRLPDRFFPASRHICTGLSTITTWSVHKPIRGIPGMISAQYNSRLCSTCNSIVHSSCKVASSSEKIERKISFIFFEFSINKIQLISSQ